jgi:hypothetical protein
MALLVVGDALATFVAFSAVPIAIWASLAYLLALGLCLIFGFRLIERRMIIATLLFALPLTPALWILFQYTSSGGD